MLFSRVRDLAPPLPALFEAVLGPHEVCINSSSDIRIFDMVVNCPVYIVICI